MSEETVKHVRQEGLKLYKALGKELYLNRAGFEKSSDTQSIFHSFRDFGEPELFLSVKEFLSSGEEPEYSPLPSFLAEALIDFRASGLKDHILQAEARKILGKQKGGIAFRASDARIRSERKKDRRGRIEGYREQFIKTLNKSYLQKLDITKECAEELGYKGFTELAADNGNYSFGNLVEEAELFIRDTEYITTDLLGWFFRNKMEIEPGDADTNDLLYMLNSFELGAPFPKQDLMEIAKEMFTDLGLVPEAVISLDSIERKGKGARGLCYPREPGREIYICTYPAGGLYEYLSFFDVIGQAMSYAHTEEDEDFENKYLREGAVIHCFSALFQNLLYDPGWLRKYLRLDLPEDFMKFLYLQRLMSTRIDAGSLIYQREVFGSAAHSELPASYSDIMERVTRCRALEHNYITGIDFTLESPARFKAIMVELQLREYLRDRFDEQWWRTKEAGDFLTPIFNDGGKLTTDLIMRKIDADKRKGPLKLKELFEQALG